MSGPLPSEPSRSGYEEYFAEFAEFGEVDALLANEKELEAHHQSHPALQEFFRFAEILRYLRTQAFLPHSPDCSARYQQEKNLGALFTALLSQRHSGIVVLEYKNRAMVIVALQQGEPCAIWSDLPGEHYGLYLIEQLRLVPAQQALLYEHIKRDTGSLGVALLESKTLSPEDFPQSVRNWSIALWRKLAPNQIQGFRVYQAPGIEQMAAPLKANPAPPVTSPNINAATKPTMGHPSPKLTAPTPIPAPAPAPTNTQRTNIITMTAVDRMSEANRQFRFAQQALRTSNYSNAISALQQCITLWPQQDAEKLAFLAIAQALDGQLEEASNHAQQALKITPDICLGWLAQHKIAEQQRDQASSKKFLKLALVALDRMPGYAQDFAMLRSLQPVTQQESATQGKYPILHLLGFVAIGLVLFLFSNGRKFGSHEYLYQANDWFFWARRASLTVLGLLGWSIYQGKMPWRLLSQQLRWAGQSQYWLALLAWGCLVGFFSPVQRIQGSAELVLSMALFHVVAEEIFFRGWLANIMQDLFYDFRLAMLASAICYGLYHLTYYSFWYETGPIVTLTEIGLIALFAAIPYHFFAQRTGSFLAPIICHLAVMWTMMAYSLLQRSSAI